MGVAKVVLNGDTLIDTTGKTVAADKMLATYTALDKAGNNVTGNIATKTSSDLTVSGATVTAPAGFYASAASKSVSSMTLPTSASATSSGTSKATIGRSTSDQYINIPTGYNGTASYYKISAVANGTAGTPTATKGTVSNHQVSITPSVTNTTGYITGGTKNGTAVTVTASELASGSKSISANGTGIDVVGYSTVDVAVPSTDFIVTLSWDTTQQKWLPDCTMADLWGAFQAGKTIALKPPDDEISDILTADGFWTDDEVYVYFVQNYTNPVLGINGTQWRAYVWTTNGVVLDETQIYIQPSGTINISQSGNIDVTNYATANVPAMTLPTAASSTASGTSKATITPSTSAQYINIPTGYNGTASYYKINAMTAMTLPTAASSSSSGTLKANITPSTSAQYINIPTGYNSSAAYYKITAMAALTLPTSTSSSATSGYTSKATITPSTSDQYLNITTGYNSTASYYKISAMTVMTLPTSTSGSASGTNKATIGRSTSEQYLQIPVGYNSSSAFYTISATPNLTLPTSASSSATSGYTLKATITPSTSDQYLNIGTGYNGTTSYYKISAMTTMTLPTSASSTSSGTSKATIGRSTSNQYINIPVGYNSTASYYTISAVANGTAGTPTATKGTVSNHQISITPSVTNTTGYITGSTKTGTAVTVTASELASGNKEITSNGTGIDVVGYSTVSVTVPTGPTYTCTISGSGSNNCGVVFNNVRYYSNGDTFTFYEGDTIELVAMGQRAGGTITINGEVVRQDNTYQVAYNLVAPGKNIAVSVNYGASIGTVNVTYALENFAVPLVYDSSNVYWVPEVVWSDLYDAFNDGQNIVFVCTDDNYPDASAYGYFDDVSMILHYYVTFKSSNNLMTWQQMVAAEDDLMIQQEELYIIPSGNKAITSNGTGIDVSTYATVSVNVKAPKYTAKILTTGDSTNAVVQFNGNNYYTIGDTIDYDAGDTLTIHCRGTGQPFVGQVYVDGVVVANSAYGVTYNYTLPSNNIEITFNTSNSGIYVCNIKSAPILDFETGTYTPESDIAQPTISFANSHDTLPMYVAIECTDPSVYASDLAASTNIAWMFSDFSQAGNTISGVPSSSSQTIYGRYQYWYRGTTAGGTISTSGGNITYPITNTTSSNTSYPRYWVTETGFKPYSSSTTRYWRSGYTYKWIAVWR